MREVDGTTDQMSHSISRSCGVVPKFACVPLLDLQETKHVEHFEKPLSELPSPLRMSEAQQSPRTSDRGQSNAANSRPQHKE